MNSDLFGLNDGNGYSLDGNSREVVKDELPIKKNPNKIEAIEKIILVFFF